MERRFLKIIRAVPRAPRATGPAPGLALALILGAPLLAACAAEKPLPTLSYAERPCYRTLADVDCHARPLVGEENRRVGSYDPPVAAEQPEQPWLLRLF